MFGDARRPAIGWPKVAPAGWFALVVVASGFITYAQSTFPALSFPVQTLSRAMLIGVVGVSAMVAGRSAAGLVGGVGVPILMFVFSALGSFVFTLAAGDDSADAVASFMFMYSVGMLLLLFLLAPVVVRAGLAVRLFCVIAVGFGLLQIARQDLLLPAAYRERFGVVYDHFVNGHVRAISFFASPPRFAEFLVFIACYLMYGILGGHQRGPLRLASFGLVMIVLYNTFSRSGYVLFLAALAVQLVLLQRHVLRERRSSGALRLYAVFAGIFVALGLLLAGRLPFDASVVDVTSLDARQGHWTDVFARFQNEGVGQLLFGSGESAHYPVLSPRYFVLDNVALAMLLYSGVVGLMIFLWLYYRLFREGLSVEEFGGASRWTPMLSFYPALLVEGMFVDNHNTIFVVQFTILGMIVWDRIGQRARDASDMSRRPLARQF